MKIERTKYTVTRKLNLIKDLCERLGRRLADDYAIVPMHKRALKRFQCVTMMMKVVFSGAIGIGHTHCPNNTSVCIQYGTDFNK